jgi:hypothetical protein
MSIENNAGRAAILYQDSLNNARNAQNSLFAQYGWTMPNSSGGYDTQSTGSAFDPNRLYNKETGVLDQAAFDAAAGQMRMGGQGILSDVMRSGGSAEADAMAQSAATGTGQGGLANQRRMLAESQTAGQLGAAKSDYLSQFAQANQPIGGAYQNLQTAISEDKVAAAEAQALKDSAAIVPSVVDTTAPVVTPPIISPTTPDKPINSKNPLATSGKKVGEIRKNAAGVKYRWNGKSWRTI